jgi:glutathione synthase/RimK-type ligase-like ATP-grasp enzyme
MSLNEIHEKLNWQETVLKPCISGAARHTYRLNKNNIADYENVFKQLVANEAMILQPFQKNIVKQGEVSLMVIDGKFTHAVLKIAKKGDFRVQDDFGGTVQTYNASLEEIKFAENAVKACIDKPIYARVDVFTDNDGILALSELELIEPELWFRNNPEASNLLAAAIKKFI